MESSFFYRNQLESQNSFYRSAGRLSENSINQNIMVRQKFPSIFKQQFWNEISCWQPQRFIHKQQKILEFLLNNEQKFILLFKQFYENHKKISDWCLLANEKHLEIKQYVFTKLLRKSIQDYKTELKDNLINKTKMSLKKEEHLIKSKFFGLSNKNSPVKQINRGENISSLPTSFHKSAIFTEQQSPNEDYHQLFVRTLDACQGSKYIFYDFRKHQKGYQNRGFYNNFIRTKKYGKQNENQGRLTKTLKELKGLKSNFQQRLPSKMFSVIRENISNNTPHHSSFSNFQMISFEDQGLVVQNADKKKKILSKKGPKKLVLKMMPHRFGNQKAVSDFLIKTQKPIPKKK